MAVAYNPRIVTDGLVLSLDAANIKSYDKYENYTLFSSGIGSTVGYAGGGIIGLNTTATTAPNNLYEASLLDNNGNTSTNYVYGNAIIGLTTNTTYTYSIHIKQGTKPDFTITIDENSFGGKRYQSTLTYSTETITTGVGGAPNDGVLVGSSFVKLPNSWYRLSLTFTTSSTNVGGFVDMINRFGNTSGSNYLWGRQLEIGNTLTDYYPLTTSGKSRGTVLTDLSGSGNNGTLTNGPTFSNSNSGSIVLDGTNDYVPIGASGFPFGSSPGTLSAWARTNTITGGYSWIVSYGTGTISQSRFLGINASTYYFGGYGNDITASGVPLNTWFNMVGVYDGTNASMYINGVLVSGPTAKTWNTVASTAQLGRQTTPAEYWNGNIAQVSIYNRALTAIEIQQNFNALRGRFGV